MNKSQGMNYLITKWQISLKEIINNNNNGLQIRYINTTHNTANIDPRKTNTISRNKQDQQITILMQISMLLSQIITIIQQKLEKQAKQK